MQSALPSGRDPFHPQTREESHRLTKGLPSKQMISQGPSFENYTNRIEEKLSPRGQPFDNDVRRSPLSLLTMSKKILQLRNANHEEIQNTDMAVYLKHQEVNLQRLLDHQLSFYTRHQMMSCTMTNMAEKKSSELGPGEGSKLLMSAIPIPEDKGGEASPERKSQQMSMLKATVFRNLRNNFEELLL